MSKTHKRRLRNYWLLGAYQLRFTAITVLLCVTLLGVLGFYWYQEMAAASEIVWVNSLSTMREAELRWMEEELASQDTRRILIMAGVGLFICVTVAGFSVVLTHKVAGPLRVMTNKMDEITAGNLDPPRELRKGDALVEQYGQFSAMVDALRQGARQDVEDLERARKAAHALIEKSGDDEAASAAGGELLEALGQLQDRRKV